MDDRLLHFVRTRGVVAYADAVETGVTAGEWRWAAKQASVSRPRRGVLAPAGEAKHVRTILAAAQAMVPSSVVSHHSAAQLHGLPMLRELDRAPTLTLPKRIGRTPRDDVGVRFLVSALPAEHVTEVGGLRVTTPARTCLDLCRITELRDGLVVTDAALGAGLDPAELKQALLVMRGWPGTRVAKAVLKLADGRRESPLESFGAAVWSENGLPPAQPQMWIYDEDGFVARVDELWEEYQTVGEADGLVKYRSPYDVSVNPLVAEKIRQERLERGGLAIVRYGSADLWRRPGQTVDRVRDAFRRGQLLVPRFLASPVQLSLGEFRRAWYARFPPLFAG